MALENLYTSSPTYKQKTQKTKKRMVGLGLPWLAKKSKKVFNNLLKEMFLEDSRGFYEFHRMSKDNFVKLLNLVSPLIRKQDTKLRKAVSPAQRLSFYIRYLATVRVSNQCPGESRRSLEFQYKINHKPDIHIIPEVCDALFAVLRGTYLKLPTTSAEWQEVASGFSNVWQFPNCIGALDGSASF
ncbi:hypothetical protein GWK47_006305 [Chionoecetes opilio]|uniref:Uncharacterized protein n=1 Tax=Chionoecetes opilio TaxID=41210 RepID=A0A8J5CUX2_CHIOP|nr:hypothetical protein GWK47_006305 [Chionoecetes opilio]